MDTSTQIERRISQGFEKTVPMTVLFVFRWFGRKKMRWREKNSVELSVEIKFGSSLRNRTSGLLEIRLFLGNSLDYWVRFWAHSGPKFHTFEIER